MKYPDFTVSLSLSLERPTEERHQVSWGQQGGAASASTLLCRRPFSFFLLLFFFFIPYFNNLGGFYCHDIMCRYCSGNSCNVELKLYHLGMNLGGAGTVT